jgi:hypothetical protein
MCVHMHTYIHTYMRTTGNINIQVHQPSVHLSLLSVYVCAHTWGRQEYQCMYVRMHGDDRSMQTSLFHMCTDILWTSIGGIYVQLQVAQSRTRGYGGPSGHQLRHRCPCKVYHITYIRMVHTYACTRSRTCIIHMHEHTPQVSLQGMSYYITYIHIHAFTRTQKQNNMRHKCPCKVYGLNTPLTPKLFLTSRKKKKLTCRSLLSLTLHLFFHGSFAFSEHADEATACTPATVLYVVLKMARAGITVMCMNVKAHTTGNQGRLLLLCTYYTNIIHMYTHIHSSM